MIGGDIPGFGLGTFGRTGAGGIAALLEAIGIGYRHIDTAQTYGTEAGVGEAIRQSGLKRDDFFVTTKVADSNLDRSRFMASVEQSLQTLGLDQVDLLLIHWPSFGGVVPLEHYVEALAEAQQRGLARLIGVSNFTVALLKQVDGILGKGAIATNQVEIHPYLQAARLCAYAREAGLRLTAYQPLALGRVAGDPVLAGIGQAHGITASAAALAFLMQEGHVVIPASSNPVHLRENIAARGVSLSAAEMAAVRKLERGLRVINPPKAPDWDD